MASSLAVIPWNQPDANKVVAKIDENSRPEGGRWGLVLHALLNPSPGRTLAEVYQSLGKAAEKQANRAAYKLGLGPLVVANKIRAYFGDSEERVQRLELLRSSVPPKLEKRCSKLMKYTQPTESGNTQCQAFKEIVDLVTLFPGLRIHFLRAKFLDGATSIDNISALWNRPAGSPDDDWMFWQSFAATCLSDTDISAMLEESTVLDLVKPRAAELLPDSSTCATTSLENILPNGYQDAKLNVTVNSENETSDAPNTNCNHSLADLHCNNDSTTSVHTKTSDQEAQDLGSDDEDREDAQSMGSSEVSSENGAHVSPASEEESYDSDTQMDNVQDLYESESEWNLGQGSNIHGGSDVPDFRTVLITGANVLNSTPYPSLKALRKEAEQQKAVLYDRRRDFGDDHPDTLAAMESLAWTHYELGEYMAARDLRVVVVEKQQSLLGANDPDMLRNMWTLASTYVQLGQFKQSERLQTQVVDIQREILGEAHPNTLRIMRDLAGTYRNLGQLSEAEGLATQVLEKQREILGDGHPDTLRSMQYLATIYKELGRLTEAEGLEVQVLEKQREVLGDDHPETLGTMGDLAGTYLRSGRLNAAEELLAVVVGKQQKVLGEDHPGTLLTLSNLALTYHNQGQFERVAELHIVVLAKRRKMLGSDHPGTRRTMRNLADTYRNLQKVLEAEELEALLGDEEI
ncbi:hypothetical protein B0H19DRAFT_1269190 [Mycena capillaripes]|nr:hypothetical protein B0H19DRAFT_1269190 [Mycena capillaripes]